MIARRKIHFAEQTSLTERFVYEADTFKEFIPIKSGHIAHARNHIADAYSRCRLVLMLGANDFIRRGALRIQPLIKPEKNGTDLGIQVSQTLDKLDRECPIQWLMFAWNRSSPSLKLGRSVVSTR